ncbi:hypothetical protein VXQ18_14530, partial [Brucella abortus]|nr:hypothetical protein [Brucella abortus]
MEFFREPDAQDWLSSSADGLPWAWCCPCRWSCSAFEPCAQTGQPPGMPRSLAERAAGLKRLDSHHRADQRGRLHGGPPGDRDGRLDYNDVANLSGVKGIS